MPPSTECPSMPRGTESPSIAAFPCAQACSEKGSGVRGVDATKKGRTRRTDPERLVARTRFELVISALRGRRPEPLDERATYAIVRQAANGWD